MKSLSRSLLVARIQVQSSVTSVSLPEFPLKLPDPFRGISAAFASHAARATLRPRAVGNRIRLDKEVHECFYRRRNISAIWTGFLHKVFGVVLNPVIMTALRTGIAHPACVLVLRSLPSKYRCLSLLLFRQSITEPAAGFCFPASLPSTSGARRAIRPSSRGRTGHSPGFFSVYTLPPNQAVSVESQVKINAKRSQTPPPRDVARLILKKSRALLADGPPPPHPPAILGDGDAAYTPFVASASVRLIVTSPPFLDIVQYAADNWLRNWFAGIDTEAVKISAHRGEAAWSRMVRDCFVEFARVVAPGGHVAFEVGEVRGGSVLLERLVWRAVEGLPFARLFVLVNAQEFTKTSHCWGVRNNAKGVNSNRIVVLRRA